ncbi:IclR family transcriptional regulator [Halobacterium bonnevillei]|uniref:Helix-turn-helix domain-containing protein n=1 Tax=Halobacterium bonnevillei TaxID=2692200 RepID=A0A6B0SCZ8_9EURY|nr:IclR family transcriptional regulator [Halobacterium bonnevillei]MXR19258.1 helix-turn-helix domain-containing protein [Halobacterium bonnevillei]
MTQSDAGPRTPVKTAERTLELVEFLKAADGATLSEATDAVDLPKSSVHNYLKTLVHHGYVVENDGTYEVGLRFLDLGAYARTRVPLYPVAEPELETVAEETGELANLLVEQDGRGTFIYRKKGENAVKIDSYNGQQILLHTTAIGKALLANLPEDRVEAILDRYGLPQKTENTITDREELFAELDRIRSEGFSYDDEERISGLNCVATPILQGDDVVGAISVTGPTSRMSQSRIDDEIKQQLRNAKNIIELNLSHA